MKLTLESLYEKILVTEGQKNDLTNPSNNEVSNLKTNQEAFGETPKVTDGPDKAKLVQGPSSKIPSSTENGQNYSKLSGKKFKGSAPAKHSSDEEADEPKETEDKESIFPEDYESEKNSNTEEESDKKKETSEEKDKKKNKYNRQHENFNMSAFENLFKKTLIEELSPESEEQATDELSNEGSDEGDLPESDEMETDEEETEEESDDLIADLKDLQDKLSSILSKLEGAMEDDEEESDESSYSEEDFDDEFSDEEEEPTVTKESIDKPKALPNSKAKQLQGKKNKVGNLSPKGGKAHPGKLKSEPKPKQLSSKAGSMQKGRPEVRSSVKKGDFIK